MRAVFFLSETLMFLGPLASKISFKDSQMYEKYSGYKKKLIETKGQNKPGTFLLQLYQMKILRRKPNGEVGVKCLTSGGTRNNVHLLIICHSLLYIVSSS